MATLSQTILCSHPFTRQPLYRKNTKLQRSDPCFSGRWHSVQCKSQTAQSQQSEWQVLRRDTIALPALLGLSLGVWSAQPAHAVQGLTAGRLPGLSNSKDSKGYLTYTRPEGKSGGHGVGWSEIPQYTFKVPEGWRETPVSIADLGGTEIDLRFGNDSQGNLAVVVAPVLRFADVGFNSDVRIQELGSPEKLITGFAPELFGSPLNEGDVIDTQVVDKNGLTFYQWELSKHRLVAATAFKNRMFLCAIQANGRQWRKAGPMLRDIQHSFDLASPRRA